MTVQLEPAGHDLVLWVTGALDAATWDRPVEVLAAALPDTDPARVVVDLGGVTFFDSSGIGCLVRLRTLCHEAQVALTLRAVRPYVRKLLVVTGLHTTFDMTWVSDEKSTGSAPATPSGSRT